MGRDGPLLLEPRSPVHHPLRDRAAHGGSSRRTCVEFNLTRVSKQNRIRVDDSTYNTCLYTGTFENVETRDDKNPSHVWLAHHEPSTSRHCDGSGGHREVG